MSFMREVAPAVNPNRGVVPGCSHAQTFVKVYYIHPLDGFCARNTKISLDVFIDDFQVAGQGEGDDVVKHIVKAALDLKQVVEQEINASLASNKAAVVASTTPTAKRIRAALGTEAGQPVCIAQALGIDFSAGRAGMLSSRVSK